MKGKRTKWIALCVPVVLLAGCGGGGGSTSSISTPPPSFSIAASPSSVSISPNTTTQFHLTLAPANGFSAPVTVGITGLPSGVIATPASPFLLPAAGLTLTLTAGSAVTNGTYSLTFQATAGSLNSSAPASLVVEPLASFSLTLFFSNLTVRQGGSTSGTFDITDSATGSSNFFVNMSVTGLPAGVTATFSQNPLPGANSQQAVTLTANANATPVNSGTAQLVATRAADGAMVSYNFNFQVSLPPGQLPGNRTDFVRTDGTPTSIVYDPVHRLLYAALPHLGRVDVIDPATSLVVRKIPVPDARGLSLSPDGTRILSSGLAAQRVAWIDTTTQQIVRRDILPMFQENCTCDPEFVSAGNPVVMANGKVFFVGGNTFVSGISVWDPAAGNITEPKSTGGTIVARSADGTKAIFADAETFGAGGVTLYDSATDSFVASRPFTDSTFAVAANPNGTQFAVAVNNQGIFLLDTKLNTIGAAPVGGLTTGLLYSSDGKDLYVASVPNNVPVISTIDAATFQIVGQAPAYASNIAYFSVSPPLYIERPMAADQTGMIFGAADHGVALDDSTDFQNISPTATTPVWAIIANPAEGPQNASTPVGIATQFFNVTPDVWFGKLRGINPSLSSIGQAQATAPPSPTAGPVNVKTISPDGTEGNMPEGFTYGAVAVDSPILAASPSGGVTAELFGFGFGSDVAGQPTQIQFGTQNGSLNYSDLFPAEEPYPFPLDDIRAVVPAGTPGPADIRVTSMAGTATISGGLHYVQSVNDYASPDTFQYILYDPKRQQVYLNAGGHIDVFSLSSRQFLSPITPPTLGGKISLVGLALSPDDSILLASNAADGSVALINPDNPQSAQAVEILPAFGFAQPSYMVTTSTGLAFINTENTNPEAGITLQLYQIDLATHSVSIAGQLNTSMLASRDGSVIIAWSIGSSGGPVFAWTAASNSWSLEHNTQENLVDGSISGDGNVFATDSQGIGSDNGMVVNFLDPATNLIGRTSLSEYQHALAIPVAGMRLNDAGSLLYVPVQFGISSESVSFGENGIDIYDVQHNELRERVMLSEQFTNSETTMMAIDPSGQHIFLVTKAGLTVVTLDAVPLSIGSVTPNSGPAGSLVTIRGSGFLPSTTVAFNGASGNATFVDADTLQATIPASLQSGAVSITVANPDGATYSLDAGFTFK
ncbi:MAG: hypothetical protein LAO08_12975 [Acidobacteriia bacterium]|nr:hypothetical protein [Terriglobia bacterium]